MKQLPVNSALPAAMTTVVTVIAIVSAWLMPGVTWLNIAAFVFIAAATFTALTYTPFMSRATVVTMTVVLSMLTVGIIANTWYFTTVSGGTLSQPVLVNVDASRYWDDAITRLGLGDYGSMPHYGLYGAIVAAVLAVFGVSIANALILNMVLLITALFVVGYLATRLNGVSTACGAIIATAGVAHWLDMGTLLLKDSWVILSMALGALALVSDGWRTWALMLTAMLMMTVARANFVFALLIGLVFVPSPRVRRAARLGLLVCGLAMFALVTISKYTPVFIDIVIASATTHVVYNAPNQLAYYALVGDWTMLPWFYKIAFMPLAIIVQTLIPFPWNFTRDMIFGPSQWWAHVTYPWYLFVSILLYYLATSRKQLLTSVTGRMTLWGIICWMIPCYLFGGTISRYGLPAVALMAPAVSLTWQRVAATATFRRYQAVFWAVMAITLVVCCHLQISAMP